MAPARFTAYNLLVGARVADLNGRLTMKAWEIRVTRRWLDEDVRLAVREGNEITVYAEDVWADEAPAAEVFTDLGNGQNFIFKFVNDRGDRVYRQLAGKLQLICKMS